jgi:hypothetical protein
MPGYDSSLGKSSTSSTRRRRASPGEAGYPNGEGLPRVSLILRSNDTNKIVAQFAQEQFKKNLGVEIDVELVDSATYQSRFSKSQFSPTFNSWSADWAYPDNWPEQRQRRQPQTYKYSNPRSTTSFSAPWPKPNRRSSRLLRAGPEGDSRRRRDHARLQPRTFPGQPARP